MGVKQRGAGFQKRVQPAEFKTVGMAVVKIDGGEAACSCMWTARATRAKVLDDKIDRHFDKRHNGRGIRL